MRTKPTKTSGVAKHKTGGAAKSKASHVEDALDEALTDTFPSSDPVAISVSKPKRPLGTTEKR